jgi:hypothetical protein
MECFRQAACIIAHNTCRARGETGNQQEKERERNADEPCQPEEECCPNSAYARETFRELSSFRKIRYSPKLADFEVFDRLFNSSRT